MGARREIRGGATAGERQYRDPFRKHPLLFVCIRLVAWAKLDCPTHGAERVCLLTQWSACA